MLAGGGAVARQRIQMRPRRFRVDEIRRHRRNAAPIIDAGADQPRQAGTATGPAGAEIGRRLDIHLGAEDEARRSDGPTQIVEIGLGRIGHAGARLGPEILDDDFLNMVVPRMNFPDRQQRLDALQTALADADQDAGGKGNRRLAGETQGFQPDRRALVGRAVMRHALLAQPLGQALNHQPLRNRYRAQRLYVGRRQGAGIEVRQQAGLGMHQLGHGGEIGKCRRMAQFLELAARRRIAQLRLVAEREQRLHAARLGAIAGEAENLVRREIGACALLRRLGEGAIMADVAAQMGERNKNLARIGDEIAMRAVA